MNIQEYIESDSDLEIRRVQALVGEKSLCLVLAKKFSIQLGIKKGDYLRGFVNGNRLILEKI
jgi:hypothetical protein